MGGKLNFRMRAFVTYASVALSGGMNIFAFRYLVLEDIFDIREKGRTSTFAKIIGKAC